MLSIKLSENGGKAPEAVPYMPAGLQEISCTVDGRAGKRQVQVDKEACERLEADLQAHLAAFKAGEKARPVVLFDHKAGEAAAVPVGFEWDEERGILLRVEWTSAGREAVEGGNYGYVSPAFTLEHGSNVIVGLPDGVEVGSLVNDPAFERNECIAAGRTQTEEVVVYSAKKCNQYHHYCGEGGEAGEGGFSFTPEVQLYRDAMAFNDAFTPEFSKKLRNSKYNKKFREDFAVLEQWVNESKERFAMMDDDSELHRERLKDIENMLKSLRKRKAEVEKLESSHTDDLPPICELEKSVERGDNEEAAEEESGRKQHNIDMETVTELLGLGADATPADIAAAVAELKKKLAELQETVDKVQAESNEHKKELEEHKERAADRFIDRLRKDGKVNPQDDETLKAAREMYLQSPEKTERIYASMKPVCPVVGKEEVQAGRVPVTDYETKSLADFYNEF